MKRGWALALALAPTYAAAQTPQQAAALEADEEKTDLAAAPAAGKGAVVGVVSNTEGPLLEAVVSVLGRREKATTDLEGRYRIDLPPGAYQLRVVYELHRPARVRDVVVTRGRNTRFDVKMQADVTAVEEVGAVEAEAERASAATQLVLRKNAAQSSDSIGAQDIAKTPDRNAADAVKRVVGTTVVDGRYIFVRGLGDRYTNSLLNGSPLPSPEPDKQAVPLDMFPTLVLSDLTVSKTFLPDMPGDFTGGSLNIHTRDLPQKFLFQSTVGLGVNSESTFSKRLGYAGGSTDFLGFDDGGRQLPKEIPNRRVTRLNPDGTLNSQLNAYGRAINGPMTTNRVFNLPHGSANFVVGDSFKLGKERVLGYIFGATYTRRFQERNDEVIRTYGIDPNRPGQLVRFNDYRAETGTDTVTWSGLGTVSYAFDHDHKIALTGLYSRNAEKEGRIITGYNEEQANTIRDERLRFVNRALAYTQLRGEHRIRSAKVATLTWNALWARATLSDPNLRENVYVDDPVLGSSFREGTQSGQHFYASQGETTRGGGLDWLQPIRTGEAPISVKAGALVTLRGRSFGARRFRFLRNQSADPAAFRQGPESLFRDENVGSLLELEEWTRPTDSYAARYNVYAGYFMGDVALHPRLRLVLGQRVEVARQNIDSFDPFAPNGDRVQTNLNRTDLLPSANVIVKVAKDANVRLSATRTVARPQLRELAPFIFSDFLGAREVLGNPNLDRTRVINLDARIEWFPRLSEVLAVSAFHKRFDKPIEAFIIPTSRGVLSYQNAAGAVNTGVEVEARKGLDFAWKRLDELSVLGNVTFVHSRVELDPLLGGIQTSQRRPLAGQSPYVFNVALDWTHEKTNTRARVLYNVSGARVAQVGRNGIPDTYEQPRHVLDVSAAQGLGKHWDLKLTIENLLDSPVRFTQGKDGSQYVAQRYSLGRTAWLMATFTL